MAEVCICSMISVCSADYRASACLCRQSALLLWQISSSVCPSHWVTLSFAETKVWDLGL